MSKSTTRHRNKDVQKPPVRSTAKSAANLLPWKIFVLMGVLLAATAAFAAFAKWNVERSATLAGKPIAPVPLSTPQYNANVPAKEYIYAGSKLLAVSEPENPPPADLAVWRPSNGNWYVLGGTGSAQVTQEWGQNGDTPAPGDFDGDGKTDFCVFRENVPSTGYAKWYIMMSADTSLHEIQWGLTGDKPAPADYDGDGKSDLAVVRQNDPSSGNTKWYIARSSDSQQSSSAFGLNSDKPAPADYDGDGLADIAGWRSSNETFYSVNSSNSSNNTIAFDPSSALTLGSAVPVSSDYDGDNKADYAIWDSAASPYAKWYIRSSISGSMLTALEWGLSSDKPVQNDYDGDGKCDIAVWRPSDGKWYIINSSDQSWRIQEWGQSGDIPVPAYYRR